jgi:cytoskeleton protein RodZ
MSDAYDNTEIAESGADEPRCGERLAVARRAQQISVLDVAKELHLDEPKVRALERNDFDLLGAPVFAKGHLRKYAQLVGFDEADIFADYYAMTRSASLPPLVVARGRIRKEFSPGPLIAALVFVVVAGSGYWWVAEREPAAEIAPVVSTEDETEQPLLPEQPQPLLPEQLQPEETLPVEEEFVVDDGPSANQPPAAIAIATPPVTVDRQSSDDGQISVSLLFSGECWTEISDADGRRLFFNMGHDQQSADIRGKAPLSALFGNVENVSVQVDGNDYALPTPTNSNRTVRVAIVSP